VIIDLVVVLAVVVLVFWGYRQGLLRKLASIGALIIAGLSASFLGREIALVAAKHWDCNPAVAYLICCVLAGALVFVAARLVLGAIARRLGSGEKGEPKPWNKNLGGLFGGLEALVTCWLVVGILDALPEDFRAQKWPGLHRQLKSSVFNAYVVHPTSPARLLELQPLINDLVVLTEQRDGFARLGRDERIRKLCKNPKVNAILSDPALIQAWQKGRYIRFFNDAKVIEALEDKEVRDTVREIKDILHKAAEEAQGTPPQPQPPAAKPPKR
jgi:uncharacterized membrane protein required for colicin V production